MNKLTLLSAAFIVSVAIGSATASAQEKERVITGSISSVLPSDIQVLDEYISSQMYSGKDAVSGLNIKLGAIYRKHDNISWDLYYNTKGNGTSSIANPANSQYLQYNEYNFGYGTYYHWNIGEKLMVKTGGMLDLYGEKKKSTPNGVNNYITMAGQVMLKAHAAIKYGWDFKKWALDLHARMSLPVFGVITGDHPSEPALALLGNDHNILNPAYNHIFFASYHNYMSMDYNMGVDFVCKPCTFTLGFGSTNKWWNVYDIQNIRKINYVTVGVSVDLVTRSKFKSSNKNF